LKKRSIHIVSLLLTLLFSTTASSQGRVVINEYMPWTLNGCGATAEFIELLNFGPGPVNIGCYVLTDGDFSVTIPANTILQPGQFYVIAGQDVIAAPCANIDSTITAHLNWNTCNCTSGPIPTTGDGFLTDGGGASEQVVLLDPHGNIVDAVVRDLPAEPSDLITTAPVHDCSQIRFDLDDMQPNYEVLGMSAGRGNSFARKLDGGCGWVKDPQQSANATNNTPDDAADVTYIFDYVSSLDCDENHGSIRIFVKRSTYDDYFPMSYTIARDANNNGVFDFNDEYSYHIDDTPPEILISNLIAGRYRITVASARGCDLKTFEFTILPCMPVLPARLDYFRKAGLVTNQQKLEWSVQDAHLLKSITVEKALPGGSFQASQRMVVATHATTPVTFSALEALSAGGCSWRLRLEMKDGSYFYSPILSATGNRGAVPQSISPNPAREQVQVHLNSEMARKARYILYNSTGVAVANGAFLLPAGASRHLLPLANLPAGMYHLQVNGEGESEQPISFRFVKQ
jgi:hypothetical protein